MRIPPYSIYLIYTSVLFLVTVLLVPRNEIRRLAVYAILLGGVFDVIWIILLGPVLNILGYINYGRFGSMGIPFFPPIAWTAWFIVFFYIMPEAKILRYAYIFVAACYSVFFANILENLEIFELRKGKIFLPFLVYISWYSFATYLFKRITGRMKT